MSENKSERTPSRISILKSKKSINQSFPNEENPDITTIKDARRVSFASSNFVKPFSADPEKNTIWDNTYEEEVNHTDSTKSSDNIVFKDTLDISSFHVLTCEGEGEIPIYECGKAEIQSTGAFPQTPDHSKTVIFHDFDMQLTDVIPIEIITTLQKKNVTSEDTATNMTCADVNVDLTCCSEDMEFTYPFTNVLQQNPCTGNVNKENLFSSTANQVQISRESKNVALKETDADTTSEDMEFTCVLTGITQQCIKSLNDKENLTRIVRQETIPMNVTYKKADTDISTVHSSDTDYNSQDMEFTCALTGISQQIQCISSLNDKENVTSVVHKETIPAKKNVTYKKADIDRDADKNSQDMEFTCVLTGIPQHIQCISSLNDKENVTSVVHKETIPAKKNVTYKKADIDISTHHISDADKNSQDMEFTCVLTGISQHIQCISSLNDKENVTSVVHKETIPVKKNVTNKKADVDTSTHHISDADKNPKKKDFDSQKNIENNGNVLERIQHKANVSTNIAQVNQRMKVVNEKKTIKNINTIKVSTFVESKNAIFMETEMDVTSPSVTANISEQNLDIENVQLNSENKSDHNSDSILQENKFKLIPEVLQINETPGTSFAMILTDSPCVEYPGKRIFTTSAKIPLLTSNTDGEFEDNFQDNNSNLFLSNQKNLSEESIKGEAVDKPFLPNRESAETTPVKGDLFNRTTEDMDSLIDNTSPQIDNEPLESEISKVEEMSLLQKIKTNSLTFDSLDNDPLTKLLMNVQKSLNAPVPTMQVPKISEKLLRAHAEAERRTTQLLEQLKFPEIQIIDLEELEKLENASLSSSSRISDGIPSSDFSDNNSAGDIDGLSVLEPNSLEDRIKEAALRCKEYWEYVKYEEDWYCFYAMYKAVPFKIKVQSEMVLVDEVQTYINVTADPSPLVHYAAKCLCEKLKAENLRSALGDKLDVFTLLDYVYICMEEVSKFFYEFIALEEEYGPTHQFRMDPEFTVIVEIIHIEYIIWWTISLDLSVTTIGYINNINATYTYEEVNTEEIQNIGKSSRGPAYLRDFVIKLDKYVEKVGKKILFQREIEFSQM